MESLEDTDISYSVFIDSQSQDRAISPLKHVLPRRTYSWVEDDSVTSCYNCQKTFSMFFRKHHCRNCGKIFCHNCSNYWRKIPESMLSEDSRKGTWNNYFASYIVSNDDKPMRVCVVCDEILETVSKVKKLIDVFNIVNLDVKQLKKIGQVGRLWHSASNFCLSLFREVQYKLATDRLTKEEKRVLWTNYEHLAGHSKYLTALIKSCETHDEIRQAMRLLKQKKKVKCSSLMCTRNCRNKLYSVDSIDLLGYCFKNFENTDLIKRIALQNLVCSDKELKCYIPFLVYNVRYDDGILTDWLIQRCLTNFELLSALYWEINLYPKDRTHEKAYNEMLRRLKKVFANKKYEKKFVRILEEASFIKIIEDIGDDIFENGQKYDQIKDKYNLKTPISTPLKTSAKVRKFRLNKIKIKNSFSKPMVLPLETTDGTTLSLLYKREGVRNDQIFLAIANLMEILVKEEEGIDLGIVNYNVIPLVDKQNNGKVEPKGIIEIVDDADTLYFIKEKIRSSILNYIMEKNGDIKINDLREKFIKSTAAYCVLTYLFGVGDRHLDNIMVTKDGRLFHIDFGYVLGKDPVFWNPSIRITPEIIEAIGGFQSEKYIEFKNLCSKIFNVMRRNINLFINLLMLLPKISDINITEKEIEEQIIKRFMPGENELDAKMYFVKQLEYNKISHSIKDFCHYHTKEKTVSSALNRLTSAIYDLWRPKINYEEDSEDPDRDPRRDSENV